MRKGDTILFETPPAIAEFVAVGGKREGEGRLRPGLICCSRKTAWARKPGNSLKASCSATAWIWRCKRQTWPPPSWT